MAYYDFEENKSQNLIIRRIILAHETAHTFGMPDVYDVEGHDVTGDAVCIMEHFEPNGDIAFNFYVDILLGNTKPFCDSCKEIMLYFTSNMNITGNQGGN